MYEILIDNLNLRKKDIFIVVHHRLHGASHLNIWGIKKNPFMWSNAYFLPPQGMYFPVSFKLFSFYIPRIPSIPLVLRTRIHLMIKCIFFLFSHFVKLYPPVFFLSFFLFFNNNTMNCLDDDFFLSRRVDFSYFFFYK